MDRGSEISTELHRDEIELICETPLTDIDMQFLDWKLISPLNTAQGSVRICHESFRESLTTVICKPTHHFLNIIVTLEASALYAYI